MKSNFIQLFLGLSIALLFSAWTFPNPWKEYVSVDGKFKALFPGKVIEKSNDIETAIGTLTYHTYLHQSVDEDADNLVYMISYCVYPRNAIHSDSLDLIDEFFDTTVATAVESVEGDLQYASAISLKEFPGRIWKVNYNEDKAMIKTKSYLVGNRYYSIQTITLKEKSLNLSTDKFLDSFYLID